MKIIFIDFSDITYDIKSLSQQYLTKNEITMINLTNFILKKDIQEYNDIQTIWLTKNNILTIGNNYLNLSHKNELQLILHYLNIIDFDYIFVMNYCDYINDITDLVINLNKKSIINSEYNKIRKVFLYIQENELYYSLNYLDNNINTSLVKNKKNSDLLYHDYFFSNLKKNINYIETINILYTSNYQKQSFEKSYNNLKLFKNFILNYSYSPFYNLTIDKVFYKKKELAILYCSEPDQSLNLFMDLIEQKIYPKYKKNIKIYISCPFKKYVEDNNLIIKNNNPGFYNIYKRIKNLAYYNKNIIIKDNINSCELALIMSKTLIYCYPYKYNETDYIPILQSIMCGNIALIGRSEHLSDINNEYLNDIQINENWMDNFFNYIDSILISYNQYISQTKIIENINDNDEKKEQLLNDLNNNILLKKVIKNQNYIKSKFDLNIIGHQLLNIINKSKIN